MLTRTEKYREIAFENGKLSGIIWSENQTRYIEALSIEEVKKEPNRYLKRAIVEKNILENVIIPLNDLELFVGRFDPVHILTAEQKEFIKNSDFSELVPSSATHHRTVDYEQIVNYGLDYIINKAKIALASTPENEQDKIAFYKAGIISLEAVCNCAKRAQAVILDKLEKTSDPVRKSELKLMAENFDTTPHKPCEHFYQALQCVWFIQFCLKCLTDIAITGHIDTYLYSLYKKDIESGYITPEFARELLDQFYYKNNELYDSWPAAVMIGGTDKDGNTVCNELTYMAIDAIERVKLINPSVALCYTEDTPQDLLEKCVHMIAKGHTRPSFFNDKLIIKGLQQAGVSEEDSHHYIHSTCVEITPNASSNIQVAAPYVNLARAFEYVFTEKNCNYIIGNIPSVVPGGGGDTKEIYLSEQVDFDLDKITTFEQFYELVMTVCEKMIEAHITASQEFFLRVGKNHSSPLSSMLLNDCIEKGLDCGEGGARYNFVYPCFPGFVNLVDSIFAVKKAVFEDKVITLRQLAKICNNDFDNSQMLAYLKNKVPKFANGIDECDNLAIKIYEFIRAELKKYDIPEIVSFHPSYFAYTLHGKMGLDTKATPDGRRNKAALSECLGASQGTDKNGVLGIVDSISKIDQSSGIGGIATNVRFTKDFIDTEKGIKSVADFIRYFMDKECFEVQFNVVSEKELLDAQKNPQNYQTLMVRVAGYSDYFVRLNPIIQEEIISRTEHGAL